MKKKNLKKNLNFHFTNRIAVVPNRGISKHSMYHSLLFASSVHWKHHELHFVHWSGPQSICRRQSICVNHVCVIRHTHQYRKISVN